MKQQVGFTYGMIASEADFIKFAIKFQILMVATLISMWVYVKGKTEFIDFDNFEISKVTFREAMGVLALMSSSGYMSQSYSCVFTTLLNSSFERIQAEISMFYGSLTLAIFLMNLLGVWGIIWLPVCPPILFLGFEFTKRLWFQNAKESHQD